MTTPLEALERLEAYAAELDGLSKDLADVERKLEPVTREYDDFMGDHEVGLWNRHVEDGEKLPPEALRARLAHREMPKELLGRYSSLTASRKRMEKRIGSLKSEIEAQRSILSALKIEAEASGAGLRRAA